MISKMIIFLTVVSLACAAVWMGKPPKKPHNLENKEGCYIREINDVISYNDEISPIGYCVRIECGKDFIHYASCGVVVTDDPKCHITETDLHRPYPDCCPKINCELDNNLV
ncbi:PREDICTED: uncharacterized protein LOC106121824 [Papilio xuthus]|uniref:Uncharacterized protein LOC106121824 n=1 Tax=Papilio xuthus TaxID=66420 RepID=I4DJB8_PAPXU|nr:uncharacterized protein LOC106121824 precursor [Papilio xuthus]BAM18008.1 unknown secreted protein [Papilio xuthus]